MPVRYKRTSFGQDTNLAVNGRRVSNGVANIMDIVMGHGIKILVVK